MVMVWGTAGKLFGLVRFEHSVFALPFALAAALYATGGEVIWDRFLLLLLAMVSARTAAMAFNRIADRGFDARNPRTRDRHLPARLLTPGHAWALVGVSSALLMLAAGLLNFTCLALSPPLLLFLMAYSYAKRFTWLSHFWLGASLGMTPLGVWLGLTERLEVFPGILAASICFWVAGFDVVYACQDVEFDRSEGLRSLPARFGIRAAVVIAAICHGVSTAWLVFLGFWVPLGWVYWSLLVPVLALLAMQHLFPRRDDLGVFDLNAIYSVVTMAALIGDLLFAPK